MRKKSVFSVVSDIIKDHDCTNPEVKLSTTLYHNLNFDDLDMFVITQTIEWHYNIDIEDEDYDKFETVKDIVDYLKERGLK